MYYLKPINDIITQGDLYKLSDQKRALVTKSFDITKSNDEVIKGYIICQWIAEGQSLTLLDDDIPGLPSKFEFYSWLESFGELKIAFAKAKELRIASTVESLYDSINSTKLSEESSTKLADSLTKLTKFLASLNEGAKTTINTRVYEMPIMKKWYKAPIIKRELEKASQVS